MVSARPTNKDIVAAETAEDVVPGTPDDEVVTLRADDDLVARPALRRGLHERVAPVLPSAGPGLGDRLSADGGRIGTRDAPVTVSVADATSLSCRSFTTTVYVPGVDGACNSANAMRLAQVAELMPEGVFETSKKYVPGEQFLRSALK